MEVLAVGKQRRGDGRPVLRVRRGVAVPGARTAHRLIRTVKPMILFSPIDTPMGRVGLLGEAGRRNPFILRVTLPGGDELQDRGARRDLSERTVLPDTDGIASSMPQAKQRRLSEVIHQMREYGEGRSVAFTLQDGACLALVGHKLLPEIDE